MYYINKMKKYLYVQTNKDWKKDNKFKFGFTTNLLKRLYSSQNQHSYLSQYCIVYQLEQNKLYSLYDEYDKIISIIGRKIKFIRHIENKFNIKLPYLTKLYNFSYLINNGGNTEYIHGDGIDLLKKIIINEFKLLNINVIEIFNKTKIQKLMNKYKTYVKKYELKK